MKILVMQARCELEWHDALSPTVQFTEQQQDGVFPQLSLTGQHDRTPVTTKHEKRLYANPRLQ